MANQWFRMYHEFAVDSKVQRLSEADQRRYIMLLCMRCCNGDVTLHDDDVTFQLRISNEEWEKTKAVLIEKKLINARNQPTNWDKRQYVSDSSAMRVARHRERKKIARESERYSNVTVTEMKRPQKQIQNTDTDKEKEKEKEKEKPPKRNGVKTSGALSLDGIPMEISPDVALAFIEHRKAMKAPLTQHAFDLNMRAAVKTKHIGLSANEAINETIKAGWKGVNGEWLKNRKKTNWREAINEPDPDVPRF